MATVAVAAVVVVAVTATVTVTEIGKKYRYRDVGIIITPGLFQRRRISIQYSVLNILKLSFIFNTGRDPI
jgi:uncharacterized membrane protein YdbT with pleckstrin-like domain